MAASASIGGNRIIRVEKTAKCEAQIVGSVNLGGWSSGSTGSKVVRQVGPAEAGRQEEGRLGGGCQGVCLMSLVGDGLGNPRTLRGTLTFWRPRKGWHQAQMIGQAAP